MRSTDGSSASVNAGPAVLTDFDDTAAAENVAELLLTRFGDPTWQEVRRRFRASELTLNEYQEITFRNIQASRDTLRAYVKQHANLRPYFKELWGYCLDHHIPMAVVSQGLDFYIEALLEKEGFSQIPVHAVTTRFTSQGISYEYPYAYPGRESQGNSKGLVVDSYRRQGYYVIYVGDGISDFEAASRADLLFAHRVLAEECHRRQIPFRPFRDFRDVLLALEEYTFDGTGPSSGQGPSANPLAGPKNSEEAPQ
jgi:2,3-diketo-5-methylthio-1-phosphopentane phosphatase